MTDNIESIMASLLHAPNYYHNQFGARVALTWRESLQIGLAMGAFGAWCQRVDRSVVRLSQWQRLGRAANAIMGGFVNGKV